MKRDIAVAMIHAHTLFKGGKMQKIRPWKKAVPEKQYRLIESILYNYTEMKKEIENWKETVVNQSRKPDDGMPKGHAFVSDPTAQTVIKLDSPPPIIKDKQKWVDVVNNSLKLIQDYDNKNSTDLYEICKEYYGTETNYFYKRDKHSIIMRLCRKLHMDESSIRRDKDLIVSKVWALAVHKQYIDPTE